MRLLTLILGVLLLPKASALKCEEQITLPMGPGPITSKDCPAAQLCGTAVVRTYMGPDRGLDLRMKSCLPPAGCGVSGSVNFGISKTLMRIECCTTDLCNVQHLTLPESPSSPNGKTCFSCDGDNCSGVLPCFGDEDRCITARVAVGGQELVMKGCASQSLCVTSQIPGMADQKSCCEGELCNAATRTAAVSLLLLLLAAASVLFN